MPTCKAEWVEYDGRSDAGPDLSEKEDTKDPPVHGKGQPFAEHVSPLRQLQSESA